MKRRLVLRVSFGEILQRRPSIEVLRYITRARQYVTKQTKSVIEKGRTEKSKKNKTKKNKILFMNYLFLTYISSAYYNA